MTAAQRGIAPFIRRNAGKLLLGAALVLPLGALLADFTAGPGRDAGAAVPGAALAAAPAAESANTPVWLLQPHPAAKEAPVHEYH